MISKNPDKVTSLKVDAIIRQGLKKFTDQIGLLWNSLADYYTRAGFFDKVRRFRCSNCFFLITLLSLRDNLVHERS